MMSKILPVSSQRIDIFRGFDSNVNGKLDNSELMIMMIMLNLGDYMN